MIFNKRSLRRRQPYALITVLHVFARGDLGDGPAADWVFSQPVTLTIGPNPALEILHLGLWQLPISAVQFDATTIRCVYDGADFDDPWRIVNDPGNFVQHAVIAHPQSGSLE